jgi:hypothetical protein
MIVVNLAKTYPIAARAIAELGHTQSKQVKVAELAPLLEATAGDWYRVSDLRIAEYGDVLVGSYAGEAVSAWLIAGHKQSTEGTVTFQLKPAIEWHQLVGAPSPGGSWKQGQARAVRYIHTDEYRRYQGKPNVNLWRANTWSVAVAHHSRISREPVPVAAFNTPAKIAVSWPHLGPIEVSITDTGILEISVPHGLRTRVTHQPALQQRRSTRRPAK